MTTADGRTGRRPGQSGTRDAILDAARARFAEVGFDKASIRSIAAAAGVDAALVHHYFGTKQDLFGAVIKLPIDPSPILDSIRATPVAELGATLPRLILGAWESPAGDAIVAAFRSVLAGGDPALVRTFILQIALASVRERVDHPAGTGDKRIALVATQMLGLLVARKIIGVEPIASMPIDELANLVAPNLQRYLTGDLHTH